MYLSYKSSSQQQNPPLYSGQYGSYVRLSSFAQVRTDFKLDFNINLFGLSESQVLNLVEKFAKEHGKTEELHRALESKKEKGGVRFVWGFLSLISGDTYDKGYNRSKVHINQNSSELEIQFYQRLFSLNPSTITVSGRGTTQSTQKTSVNLEILAIKEENNQRVVSIIFAPKTENFDQDDHQTQKVQNKSTYKNILGLLKNVHSKDEEQNKIQEKNVSPISRLCALQDIYGEWNNFNLKPVQSPDGADAFPTQEQAISLYNSYIQKLQKQRAQHQLHAPKGASKATFAYPSLKKFKGRRDYISKLWPNGTTITYCFLKYQPLINQKGQTIPYIQNWERNIELMIKAFQVWKDTGINLNFKKIDEPSKQKLQDAYIRIAFYDIGSFSRLGTDSLETQNRYTMNIGWDLTQQQPGTGIHEIGHALGLHHEHQNPASRLYLNEKQIIKQLSGYPNYWQLSTIKSNVLSPIPVDEAKYSEYDPNSIMHYHIPGRQLLGPPQYLKDGVGGSQVLSDLDKQWIVKAYPPSSKNKDDHFEELTKKEVKKRS